MNPTAQSLDCRGQQCPQPILTTAKAARALKGQGGGVIEISADDAAFPLDIKSWCRSSGSELVGVTSGADGVHHAVVRIPGSAAAKPAPRPAAIPSPPSMSVPVPASAAETLDCRGMQCPQPILRVAKQARTQGSGTFEVVADDPAFKLDLDSWGRSSGHRIEWVREGKEMEAKVYLSSPGGAAVAPAPAVSVAPAPMPAPSANDDAPALEISLSNLDDTQRMARLHAIGSSLTQGERVRVRCKGNSFTAPLLRWAAESGHEVLSFDGRVDTFMELRAGAPTQALATVSSTEALQVVQTENRCTLLVLHNDKEALLAALLVAVGAAAQGMEVVMFFTFWGLNLLRGDEPNTTQPKEKVSWMQRMMKWMMPKGPRRQKLGQMDMGGVGRGMLKSIMDNHNIMDIPELMDSAEEQGVQFIACTMSMQVMGITKRDLAPRGNVVYGGVAAFVESAGKSNLSLMF